MMNGALLQARLLEKKAEIESVKSRVAGLQARGDADENEFVGYACRLSELAREVKWLGDEYARWKGWDVL